MTADFATARTNMVESQVRTNDVTDLTIQDAMRRVAREAFCPPGKLALAYADDEVEYAPGRYLMRPRDVAKLLQALGPRAGERALAIAAPYAAAVLEDIGLVVDRHDGEDLLAAPAGPYDLVICEGGVTTAPECLARGLGRGRPSRRGRAFRRLRTCGGLPQRWRERERPPRIRQHGAVARRASPGDRICLLMRLIQTAGRRRRTGAILADQRIDGV